MDNSTVHFIGIGGIGMPLLSSQDLVTLVLILGFLLLVLYLTRGSDEDRGKGKDKNGKIVGWNPVYEGQ